MFVISVIVFCILGVLGGLIYQSIFEGKYNRASDPWSWVWASVAYWVLIYIFNIWMFCEFWRFGHYIGFGILYIICGAYFIIKSAPIAQCPHCGEWFTYVRTKRLSSGSYESDDIVERDIMNRDGDIVGSYETTERRTHFWSVWQYTCNKCGHQIKI